uniref:uncharacterized protein LOC120829639 n=1 Tax=Gasterosteus aculeatus aculeatus TaxID=481459 RepID=UPI001A989FD9|nr:uncharacterized protein LOC120829639 [Gasterosteus aculeatus aculeatus]
MPEFRACKRHAKANRVNVSPRSSRPNLVPTALRPSEVRIVTSARGPSSLLQRDTCLVRETERRFATLSEPAVLEAQRGEEERRTGKEGGGEKGGREDGQQGVEESHRAPEKFLLPCPYSQNGGGRTAAWQLATAAFSLTEKQGKKQLPKVLCPQTCVGKEGNFVTAGVHKGMFVHVGNPPDVRQSVSYCALHLHCSSAVQSSKCIQLQQDSSKYNFFKKATSSILFVPK